MDRRLTDGFRRVEGEPQSAAGGWVEAARWVGVGSVVSLAAACSFSYVALSTLGAVQALGVAGHPGSSPPDGSTSAREIRIDLVWICVSLLVLRWWSRPVWCDRPVWARSGPTADRPGWDC